MAQPRSTVYKLIKASVFLNHWSVEKITDTEHFSGHNKCKPTAAMAYLFYF